MRCATLFIKMNFLWLHCINTFHCLDTLCANIKLIQYYDLSLQLHAVYKKLLQVMWESISSSCTGLKSNIVRTHLVEVRLLIHCANVTAKLCQYSYLRTSITYRHEIKAKSLPIIHNHESANNSNTLGRVITKIDRLTIGSFLFLKRYGHRTQDKNWQGERFWGWECITVCVAWTS